jgi:hypothetical protein
MMQAMNVRDCRRHRQTAGIGFLVLVALFASSGPAQDEGNGLVTSSAGMVGPDARMSEGSVTINAENVSVADVLNVFSKQTGMNIVIGPAVTNAVNVRLKDIPWDEALEGMLNPYGYGYRRIVATIVVNHLDRIVEVEKIEPLVSHVFDLNYLDASDIKEMVESMLSLRGHMSTLTVRGQVGGSFGTAGSRSGGGQGAPLARRERGNDGDDLRSKVVEERLAHQRTKGAETEKAFGQASEAAATIEKELAEHRQRAAAAGEAAETRLAKSGEASARLEKSVKKADEDGKARPADSERREVERVAQATEQARRERAIADARRLENERREAAERAELERRAAEAIAEQQSKDEAKRARADARRLTKERKKAEKLAARKRHEEKKRAEAEARQLAKQHREAEALAEEKRAEEFAESRRRAAQERVATADVAEEKPSDSTRVAVTAVEPDDTDEDSGEVSTVRLNSYHQDMRRRR